MFAVILVCFVGVSGAVTAAGRHSQTGELEPAVVTPRCRRVPKGHHSSSLMLAS